MKVCTCPCHCGARLNVPLPISRIGLSVLTEAVALECGVSIDELLGESRKREFARPRQLLCLLARDHSGLSSARIAHFLRGRNHSTILYGAGQMERLIAADAEWAELADRALARARRQAQRRMLAA